MQSTALNAAKQCFRTSIKPYRCLGKSPFQRPVSAAAAGEGQIQPPNVQNLAKMANIAVTDEEAKEWGPKIEKIVEWFGQLQEVDLEGVPPALRAEVESENTLRADQPRDYPQKEELLNQVPDMENGFVKVPKTKQSLT